MPLTFALTSPHDVLAKAQRDLDTLKAAVSAQSHAQISDALYNFAVTAFSVKDWLKEHPSASFSPQDVENFAQASVALRSYRDIANANKHRLITKYNPTTDDVTISAYPQVSMANWLPLTSAEKSLKPFRLKILQKDGARLDAVALAEQALEEWRQFFARHAV